MTKQFDITVKIRVTVPDDDSGGMNADQWAGKIASDYAKMSQTYKSINAEEIISLSVEEV